MTRYRVPAYIEVEAEGEQQAIMCAHNTLQDRFESHELTNESPEVTYWGIMNTATRVEKPDWNAELASHAAAVVTRAKQGTIALGLVFSALSMAHSEGHAQSLTDYPIIGTPAYSAGCELVREWEDGGALAYCPEDGETYVYDADGGFIIDNGIKVFYRPEGSWYIAPERWQAGPGAR